MNAMVKTQVMDWSKFTAEEWLKQYGAYVQTCRMKSGNEPDSLGVNQIYWLICENNKGVALRKDQVICKINDFEAEEVQALCNVYNVALITVAHRQKRRSFFGH